MIANDEIYKHAKYQCKILSTLGYTKITKCVDLRIVNSAHFQTMKPVRFCHFCVVYNTKKFTLKFCTFVDFIIV
jgi:hypothetical protein